MQRLIYVASVAITACFLLISSNAIEPSSALPSSHFVRHPKIQVDAIESKMDEPLRISVVGLSPNQKATIHARSYDAEGTLWYSEACYRADPLGSIYLREQAPLYGTYKATDGMGLFWSMIPTNKTSDSYQAPDPQIIELSLEEDNKILDTVTLKRYKMHSDVVRVPVKEEGIIGTYFHPKGDGSYPGVIVLGGSHGGLHEGVARMLATHGYATLALAYFGIEGLPSTLEQIPLEYFDRAIRLFQSKPEVDKSHIGIIGTSRGAELTLLLASTFPSYFHAVVAYVPSHVIFAGLPNQNLPAWTYKGKPVIPSLKIEPPKNVTGGKDPSTPASTTPLFRRLFAQKDLCVASEIPVEKIQSPLMLISGEDDQMWPSFDSASYIVSKIKKARPGLPCEHLHYPGAGHAITLPFLPTTHHTYFHPVVQLWLTLGGSPLEDAIAAQDSWQKIKTFLQIHLRPSP